MLTARIVNFVCVALMGLTILALYHVSEKTRVAGVRLSGVERQITQEHATMSVLQTEWERVAAPTRIQTLAQAKLGMQDSASLQLSSLELLPRRGDQTSTDDVRQASDQVPAQETAPHLTRIAARTGD